MSYSSSSPTHTSGPEPSSKVTIIWSLLPRRTGNMWSASLPKETHFFQVEFQLWWHSNAFWWNSNAYQCSIWHGFNVQMQSFHNQVMVQYSFYGVHEKTKALPKYRHFTTFLFSHGSYGFWGAWLAGSGRPKADSYTINLSQIQKHSKRGTSCQIKQDLYLR